MTNKRKIRRAKNLDGKRKEMIKKRRFTYVPCEPILDDMLLYELCSGLIFRSSPALIKTMCSLYNNLF